MDHQFRRKYNRMKLAACLTITLVIAVVAAEQDESNPTFTVESTLVKAYNMAADNRLFCIINLGIRVHNPRTKQGASYEYKGIEMEVRKKGKHHKLADDALPDFSVGPNSNSLVVVEAVGLRVDLRRETAAEVRADVVAGEGRVDVVMNGGVGSDGLRVTCSNVAVDFSGSTAKAEKVECEVRMGHVSSGDPAGSGSMAWTGSGSSLSPTNGIRY